MQKTSLLFLIILIEGYVVLACELLAIRQLIPFVGSGTETISIVISAVLLPLAVGYHFGGRSFARHFSRRKRLSVRKILLKNTLSALAVLTLGLSYVFMELFFGLLSAAGITQRLLQTAIYSGLFLVMPVFLLGQTVPLISHYFSRRKLSEITGKMLFFSTAGSFLGSVFSTIVLMTTIGVHNTVMVTLGLLAALCLLLLRRLWCYETLFIAMILGALFQLNNDDTMRSLNIVSDNAYNTISIQSDKDGAKTLLTNRSNSSRLGKHSETFSYVRYINETFIAPLTKAKTPADILVIGAGGFTLGIDDKTNHYTFVDIDKALKPVSEAHFLPEKLSSNKRFVVASARAFVRSDDKKYDLIVLDTFTNIMAIPMETTTREYLLDVKKLLKDRGILIANIIMRPTLNDKFSVRYNATFASVFPAYSRQIIGDFNPWLADGAPKNAYGNNLNILYMYFNGPLAGDRTAYTDDKNTYSLDRN